MVSVQRVMTVSTPAEIVLGYLADFGHAEVWDPGTRSCTRADDGGPVDIGSTWRNVSVWGGRETELTYRLASRTPDRLTFVGQNSIVTVTARIRAGSAADGGSTVTYHADLRFKGLVKLATPFLRREIERLGDELERTLPPVLERL